MIETRRLKNVIFNNYKFCAVSDIHINDASDILKNADYNTEIEDIEKNT